jgi:DNA-binding MarR family transcriptional regulator
LTINRFADKLDRYLREAPMTQEKQWFEDIVMPALLRQARATYGMAMHEALAQAGCDDVPKNGLYIIGGLALGVLGVPLGRLAKELGVSKQAVGQLVDTLVLRGYLERTVDEEDRRKLTLTLTARGRMAAAVQAAAREQIDAELLARVGAESVHQTRRTLAALVGMRQEQAADDH